MKCALLLATGLMLIAGELIRAEPNRVEPNRPEPARTEPARTSQPIPALPAAAKLELDETWSQGKIDPARWYLPRKHWGAGNSGVCPENVQITTDVVDGKPKNVLRIEGHGDQYDGPVVGYDGSRTRVGGIIVSKQFFASGRFQVVMRIGSPASPRPRGMVPAMWTYSYRYVSVPESEMNDFSRNTPLYNPDIKPGHGENELSSEIDFPEFGKGGVFEKAMYNTFTHARMDSRTFDVTPVIDGQYHTLTTDWHTHLVPMKNVTDAQVVEFEGFYWIRDKAVPFESYLGNPLKKLGPNQYALCTGQKVVHWIDGHYVGENTRYVPAMDAQLTLGIWFPKWAGDAPWKSADLHIASVKVWQFHEEGDVRNLLPGDLADNFDRDGKRVK